MTKCNFVINCDFFSPWPRTKFSNSEIWFQKLCYPSTIHYRPDKKISRKLITILFSDSFIFEFVGKLFFIFYFSYKLVRFVSFLFPCIGLRVSEILLFKKEIKVFVYFQ